MTILQQEIETLEEKNPAPAGSNRPAGERSQNPE